MARFTCPRCQTVMEVAQGTAFACPQCGQRLQVPGPAGGPPVRPTPATGPAGGPSPLWLGMATALPPEGKTRGRLVRGGIVVVSFAALCIVFLALAARINQPKGTQTAQADGTVPEIKPAEKVSQSSGKSPAEDPKPPITGKLPEPKADPVALLIKDLKDPNVLVRLKAVRGLASFVPARKEAVDALRLAEKDVDEVVQAAASRALEKTRKKEPTVAETVAQLVARLKDPDPFVRLEAARALGRLGAAAKGAEATLAEVAANDPDEDVSLVARKALQTVRADPQVLSRLIKELKDKDPVVRLKAVRGLAAYVPDSPEAVEALRQAEKDEDEVIAAAATRILQPLAKSSGKPVDSAGEKLGQLLGRLRDSDPLVRFQAVRAIEQLGVGGKTALPALQQVAATDPDEDVSRAALKALQTVRAALEKEEKVALEGVANGLQSKDIALRLKALAQLQALGLEGQSATPLVLQSMVEILPAHRDEHLATLARIHPVLHQPMMSLFSRPEEERYKALESIAALGSDAKGALPALMFVFKNSLAPTAATKVFANGDFLVGALYAMSKVASRDRQVGQAMLEAMLAANKPVQHFTYVGSDISGVKNFNSRVTALYLAETIGVENKLLIPVLLRWLDDFPSYQLLAISRFERMGPAGKVAIPKITEIRASSSDKKVREAASAALLTLQN